MTTIRIVLTEPFIKHPAGLVFELNEATGIRGWDDDERLRERLNFSDKSTYHIPDGGNGLAYDLLVSSTAPCPPGVFDKEDLHSGPCRLTRAAFQRDGAPNDVWNPGFVLFETNGLNAQGFMFPLENFAQPPSQMELHDVLRDQQMRTLEVSNCIDCSDLSPGFYQLRLRFQRSDSYYIHFIKSFPLLVVMTDGQGRHSVQKTVY